MKNIAFLGKFKDILKNVFSDKKKSVLIVSIVAILVLFYFCSSLFSKNEISNKEISSESVSVSEYSKSVEEKLESMLLKVTEINSASVMVMVESTPKIEYLTETEETISPSENGSTSTKATTVVFEKNGSVSTPVVITTFMPKVTGVFIVVNAVSASTKLSIINSISVVLNIEPSCISILQES